MWWPTLVLFLPWLVCMQAVLRPGFLMKMLCWAAAWTTSYGEGV